MTKEIKNNFVSPTEMDPKYVISLFCVPKKDKNDDYVDLRLVRNASAKEAGADALNEYIEDEDASIKSLPSLETYATLFSKHKFIWTKDLSDYFRRIPTRKATQEFTIYSLFGYKLVDHRVGYGVTSGPVASQTLSEAIVWMLDQSLRRRLRGKTMVYIDDFVIAANTLKDENFISKKLDKLLIALGIPQSDKQINGQQQGKVHGVYWNLAIQSVSISDDKLKEIVW